MLLEEFGKERERDGRRKNSWLGMIPFFVLFWMGSAIAAEEELWISAQSSLNDGFTISFGFANRRAEMMRIEMTVANIFCGQQKMMNRDRSRNGFTQFLNHFDGFLGRNVLENDS